MRSYGVDPGGGMARNHARCGFAPSFDRAEAKRPIAMLAKQAANEPAFRSAAIYIEIARLLDPADRSLVSACLKAYELADLFDEMSNAYFNKRLPSAVHENLWQALCQFSGWSVDRTPGAPSWEDMMWSTSSGMDDGLPTMAIEEFEIRFPALARRFLGTVAPALSAKKRRRPAAGRRRPVPQAGQW